MKIDLLVPYLSEGGQARGALLAAALRTVGCEARLLGCGTAQELYVEVPEGIELKCLSHPLQFLTTRSEAQAVIAIKTRWNSLGVAMLDRLFTGRPLLLDIDDWELAWPNADSARSLRLLNHLAKSRALVDGITVVTHVLQERFGGTIVPNGCDTDIFDPGRARPDRVRKAHRWENLKLIVFAGAPRPHKGLEDVLQAITRLARKDVRLVIVGKNPYDDYHLRLRRNWRDLLELVPAVNRNELPDYLAAADIIALAQRAHPGAIAQLPLKLPEALAMGRPLLATAVGDIPRVVGDAAVLVPPGDIAALHDAIEQMLCWDESRLEAQARRARARSQQYSLPAIGRTLRAELARATDSFARGLLARGNY